MTTPITGGAADAANCHKHDDAAILTPSGPGCASARGLDAAGSIATGLRTFPEPPVYLWRRR